MKSNYDIIKLVVYFIGFGLTIFSIVKFGLVDSHTSPLGFVIPVLFLFLGMFWALIGFVAAYFFRSVSISYKNHHIGIGVNFIILISG
jgi:hypothetical protein